MTPALPAAEGRGYTPLPEGSIRPCSRCGAPARYVQTPATLTDALGARERLCAHCYRERVPANERSPLTDPDVWNPPEGGGGAGEPEPIPATYRTPPEPDLPDLPQPDDVAGLDDAGVGAWVDRLCAAEVVRSPGTRYAAGLPAATVRAELRADVGNPQVQQGYVQYCDARRRAWERECGLPRYEGEHRELAIRAEALRLASEGYDATGIYHGLLTFNQGRCLPPLYAVPSGPDGEVGELQDLAEGTYRDLPLSALRVEEMPEILDANVGGGKVYRNDRRTKRILLVILIPDKDGGVRETPNVLLNLALEAVTVRVSPRGGVTRYECRFVGAPRTVLNVSGTLPEIAGRLVEEGVVIGPHLLQPALAAIVQSMRERQTCTQSDEEYLPGFFPARYRNVETREISLADGITAVGLQTPPLTRAGLREALTGLNQIVTRWHSYSEDATTRVATALKWGVVAPFGFVRKHVGITSDHLILSGNSQTGKSLSGQMVLSLWNRNNTNHRIQYGAFNTEARAGEQLARYTYPVVVDEMNLGNEALEELLKNVWESLISREPLTVTRQRQPRDALASVVLTSNTEAPIGDGMRNRSAILSYGLGDKAWTLKHKEEFRAEGTPHLERLPEIGAYVWAVVQRCPEILNVHSWADLGTAMLEGAYRYAGMEIPPWIYITYDYVTDTTVEARVSVALALRDYLTRVFSQEFPRYRNLFSEEASWEEEFWDLRKRLDLLVAVGALAPIHPIRRRGARAPSGVREAIAAADEIEAVRIDAGLFQVPEIANSPEVKKNLHGDLENLARILGIDRPRYQNLPINGRRSKRLAVTVPKSLLVNLIEAVTGSSDD